MDQHKEVASTNCKYGSGLDCETIGVLGLTMLAFCKWQKIAEKGVCVRGIIENYKVIFTMLDCILQGEI